MIARPCISSLSVGRALTVLGLALVASVATPGPAWAIHCAPCQFANRADIAMREGRFQEVVDLATQAIENRLQPRHQRMSDEGIAGSLLNRAAAYRRLGEFQRAVEDNDLAIELYERGEGNDNVTAIIYTNRGLAYSDLGEHARAIEDHDQALRLNPSFIGAYRNRASALTRVGEYGAAIEDLDRYLGLNPGDRVIHIRRGRYRFHAGDFDAAADDFAAAQGLGDLDIFDALWEYLALARNGAGDAAASLSRATENSDLGVWPGPLAQMFLGALSPADAELAARDGDPEIQRSRQTEAFFFVGQFHLLQGDPARAAQSFGQALDLGSPGIIVATGARAELDRLAAGDQ